MKDTGANLESRADSLFAGPSEMAALMRAKDWSATSLGPPAGWPRSLRTVVRIMLTSRFSMWLGWGKDLTFFYNDAYRPTLGAKHPLPLGMPTRDVWAEIWPALEPRVTTVLTLGEATWDEALLLFLERNGYPEETYHTFSYSPLPDDADAIGGLLCVVTEETERVIGERRLALLREIATELAGARTDAEVFAAVDRTLGSGTADLPFALAYLFDDGTRSAELFTRTTFPATHAAVAEQVELDAPGPWPLRDLFEGVAPIEIELAPGDWPVGPWSVGPSRAFAIPVARQGQRAPAGAFIAGLNPYRAFDADYRDFLLLFVGQIAAGLATARAYEAERRRAESLAELDRAKTAFFSNVSHELRTPLTLILGPLAEMLGDDALPPREREQLASVHRNALRLLKLVNTMLDFSRIEAGRVQAHYEPVDLSEYTRDLASVFRSATDRAGLRLVVDCPPVGEPVFVDRDMWEKIVFNLVSNAFKFTLKGEIAVSLARRGERVELSVKDTGSGVPAHELPHLFDRFHRVEGARGRTHEGTGIGLALVQELVKLHSGTIDVVSVVDAGTTFTVSIPLGAAHLPVERVGAVARGAGSRGSNAFVEEAMRWLPALAAPDAAAAGASPPLAHATARVLLADDNADMREYIRRLLGSHWTVEAVSNGREAMDAVARTRPDIVITDVMMPVLDGFGLLDALRADERSRTIPVLMLSARAGEEARVEALEAGASDYLVKPFAARELIARIDSLLLQSRIRAIEEAQARRLASVFEQAPVGIAILRGPSHVFEVANPVYLALLGGRDVVGKSVGDALPQLEGQGIHDMLDQVYASGEPFVGRSVKVLLDRRGDGAVEECFFDLAYQPMTHEGRVEAIAIVAFEVTELARAKKEAELANRAKDEFLAMLGHELRNPLAPIVTALQLMRHRNPGVAEKERGVIERQVRHLVRLVDDLLDVSRVTGGKIELKRQRLELADVVAQAIETASPLLEQHRHILALDVPRPGFMVNVDPARFAQVVSNLLANAAKYTPDGGRILVQAEHAGDDVVLRVRDSGIGIDREMLPRIFEPFTQVRQALDRSQGGLGLGLAIVRSLVTLHGGSVSASSEGAGRGTELVVRIPRPEEDAPRDSRSERPVGRTSAAPGAGRPRRVLIVDDNEDAAVMLSEMLAATGCEIRLAHDGPSALTVAEAFDPDVAILDIGLPVMDGFELAARFREHPRLQRARLIAVTGYGQAQDRARSNAAGFEVHLVKPVELDAVRAAVNAEPRPVRATSPVT